MFAPLLKKLFGSKNEREVKRMLKTVQVVNSFEEQMVALSDEQLRGKTAEFKERLAKGETLDQLLPEAFAVAREAGKRIMGMRHFDVQLIGGMTLHEGMIAEMRTGEGKTLVATLGVYLNALSGKGVHVVTVNDYLARRDANWMRPLYEFLGLTVGVVTPFQPPEEKRAAYAADITYGTNNEFGFDYLRDNMAFSKDEKFQRELNFAVIDEVDSILIDEARTPLIISGQAEDSSKLYIEINKLIPRLTQHIEEVEGEVTQEGHYKIDEKSRQVELNEAGHQFIEEMLTQVGLLAEGESLYSAHNLGLLTHVYAGLRAHKLFHRNVEYIVQDGQVLLIDEHTGRTMPGRRLSEGLHQAIEAKENLNIQAESQTLASTTFQNYFRLYTKLSGMTGTADTEAFEFAQIYALNVMVIPPNKPLARKDFNDLVYLTADEKYAAIIADIKESMASGRPVLVGTATIETSEHMSNLLKKEGIDHKVLNAKYHEKEAEIIAQAGRPGALTIATNMAGRGTDILLGGNWEVEVASMENPTPEQIAQIKADWQKRHQQELVDAYNEKEDSAGAEALRTFEKQILLRVLDDLWKDHLSTMDHLRHGIHLRGYAQKNPKQEYKRESFTLFQELLDSIKRDTIRVLSHVQVRREDPVEEEARLRREAEELAQRMQFQHAAAPGLEAAEQQEEGAEVAVATPARNDMKLGRNEVCWCGSGKKFKHCHGQIN
ncbi:hypothetical protein L1887_60080 [Cichorium endivia]|nr:hypothetical protein L1887_60080 [Cichorium endivia]